MAFIDDLLNQAKDLIEKDCAGRPKQANLRRAVSSAYYALFHAVIDESISMVLKGETTNAALQRRLQRTVSHKSIKDASMWVTGVQDQKGVPDDIVELSSTPPDSHLINICKTFTSLQKERYRADYNLAKHFSRQDANRLVHDATVAVNDLRSLQSSDWKQVFLLTCVLGSNTMQRNAG